MSDLRDLFASTKFKAFFKRLSILTAIVAVLGLIMLLIHAEGATWVLILAGVSALVLLLLYLLQMVTMRKDN